MNRSFCTIVSSNYLAQAEVLINSFKIHHPNDDFHLLILDIIEIKRSPANKLKIWAPEEIGINPSSLNRMRQYYDVVEFATSLKPFFLNHLLDIGSAEVTYLDPDIKIFAHIDSSIETSSGSTISLTPHRLTPPSSLELGQAEREFLKYGTFNLGFISILESENSRNFLKWWQTHLVTDSRRRPISELFTDQKWIDLVPSYFHYNKVRDYGFNVAPWNLDERCLSYIDGRIVAGKHDLKFVHFSQISSLLKIGDLSKAWRLRLSNSGLTEETRINFEALTREYSLELKETHSQLLVPGSYVKAKYPFSKANYLLRDKIQKRMSDNEIGSRRLPYFYQKYISKSLNFLTKLDSFNGLVWGIKSDIARIQMKMKNRKLG